MASATSGDSSNVPCDASGRKLVEHKLWRAHDWFNIATLPIVCCSNILFLSTAGHHDVESIQYQIERIVFSTYITVDSIWILLYPKSVPSPNFILWHHVVCLIGYNVITWTGDNFWVDIPSEMLIVEVNTWFMTSRRYCQKDGILHQIAVFMFYCSWIAIRNIFYPYKFINLLFRYFEYSMSTKSIINLPLFFVILLGALNFLNVKWTYELFFGKSKKNVKKS